MKKYFLIILLLNVAIFAKAQAAKDSIIATINKFFAGIKNADTALLKASLTNTALLQTVRNNAGKISVENEQISGFIDFVSKQKTGDADEQIKIETVISDGALATVWTPYQFYYKGKFSHCGVNSFQLVRIDGKWKIQYIIDTRKREGCQ